MTVLKEPYPHLFYIPPGVPVPTGALAVQQGRFLLPATHVCMAHHILQQFDFIRMGLLALKTLINKQATRHNGMPSLLGDGDKPLR
jgi:hypothetical protein